MSTLSLIIALGLLGLLVYFVRGFLPLSGRNKAILNMVIVIFAAVRIFHAFANSNLPSGTTPAHANPTAQLAAAR